jgi:prepilin-type N-terminal cleavage/methylation domain-containing protein
MKKAFSMIELIIVIVVIGILAVVMIPRIDSNRLQEAAVQVVSHIRYTQHLAMVDDKFDAGDDKWFRENWQIEFVSGSTEVGYKIYSDQNHLGSANNSELAIDPLTRKRFSEDSDVTNLKTKYGVTQVEFSDNCKGDGAGKELSFDFQGRPHIYITSTKPDTSNIYAYLLRSTCEITLSDDESSVIIAVEPETGYAHILY